MNSLAIIANYWQYLCLTKELLHWETNYFSPCLRRQWLSLRYHSLLPWKWLWFEKCISWSKKKKNALHWEFPSLQGSGHCTVLHSKYMVMASHIFIIGLCFTKSYIIEHVISKHKRISRQVNRKQWNDITLHFEKNLQLNLSVNHAV